MSKKRGGREVHDWGDLEINPLFCNHIYGFDEGYSSEGDIEYEKPTLIHNKDLRCGDIVFKYCPLCGGKLDTQQTGETL